jgi:hypothetical protein
MALLDLCPQIQEELLALPPVTAGRDPVSERGVRAADAETIQCRHLGAWQEVASKRRSKGRSLSSLDPARTRE